MKIRCEWCGSYMDDTDAKCPNCDGANHNVKRSADGLPRTIQELKNWCHDNNMPLEKMRFFIGEDYRGAKAFGIYQDVSSGNFVVYKNKSDGTRAVRYEGDDEAYAVNEIYQKIKLETAKQVERGNISRNTERSEHSHSNAPACNTVRYGRKGLQFSFGVIRLIAKFVFVFIVMVFVTTSIRSLVGSYRDSGYYMQDGVYYYNDYSTWYRLDGGDWTVCTSEDISKDAYLGSIWDVSIPDVNFKTSGYWEPESNEYFDYNGTLYAYYSNWYKWTGSAWRREDTNSVPLELRRYYNDYGLGWDVARLPYGADDFRQSEFYSVSSGYYNINGSTYYNQYGAWYLFNGSDYVTTTRPYDVWQYEDYVSSEPGYGISEFEDSDSYESSYDSYDSSDYDFSWDDGGWDDDYDDYDYGGWDSNDTDWDTDW